MDLTVLETLSRQLQSAVNSMPAGLQPRGTSAGNRLKDFGETAAQYAAFFGDAGEADVADRLKRLADAFNEATSAPERKIEMVEEFLSTMPSAKIWPFRFEHQHSRGKRIQPEQISLARDLLIYRLGFDAVKEELLKSQAVKQSLERFACDVALNIDYYENRIAELQKEERYWVGVTKKIGIAAIVLIIAFAFIGFLGTTGKVLEGNAITAQIALLVGGLLASIRVLASATDVKAKIRAFWKASSSLKTELYTFEDHWRRRLPNTPGTKEFEAAVEELKSDLMARLEKARTIGEEERSAFFDATRSADDVAKSVTELLDAVVGRRKEVGAALGEAAKTAEGQQRPYAEDLRLKLRDAEAAEVSAKAISAEAAKDPSLPADKVAEAKMTAITAGGEVKRLRKLLGMPDAP